MSLMEVDEATSIIHEAAGDDANVILGTVIDENMKDEIMVTVIATGLNKKVAAQRPPKATANLIDRIPTGPTELQRFDEPSYLRRGVELSFGGSRTAQEDKEKIDKTDPDKPAFLRKIMD